MFAWEMISFFLLFLHFQKLFFFPQGLCLQGNVAAVMVLSLTNQTLGNNIKPEGSRVILRLLT